jgi:hypothetical protein
LLKPVGTEGVSDGEFCETSDETVPVVKSSAKKSEPDLPRFPERLIGAPNENAAEKMVIRVDGVQLRPRHIAIVFR